MFLSMPLFVKIMILAIATLLMAMILYGAMQMFDRQLPKDSPLPAGYGAWPQRRLRRQMGDKR